MKVVKWIIIVILGILVIYVISACSSQTSTFPPPAGYSSWEEYNNRIQSATTSIQSTTPVSDTTAATNYQLEETVELNYGEHKSVTYQQIKDKLVYYFNRDIKSSKEDGFEYQLKEITIENNKIIIFLELHFQPSSKAWLIHDAYSWLWLAAFSGFDIDGKFAGVIYNTGYEISVIMSTSLSDGNIISWGTAKIKDSGKPFDDNTFNRDRIWIDGAGMELLN
jgi:hypothetical protein